MQPYTPSDNLLENRIILITGAGDGIGKAAAITYAKAGATVILLGKTISKLETVYDEIEQNGGPQPAIYPMNLEGASGKDYEDMLVNLDNEFGRLDGILHNAALLGALTPIAQYDLELWNRVMQVNLTAPYLLTRILLPLLMKSTSASVIFTTDDVGIRGKAYWGAYAITKAACDNMMQILADEMEVNTPVRFNSINPGTVATGLRSRAYPAENPERLQKPQAIMNAYLYLMGDDSKDINGQIINAQ